MSRRHLCETFKTRNACPIHSELLWRPTPSSARSHPCGAFCIQAAHRARSLLLRLPLPARAPGPQDGFARQLDRGSLLQFLRRIPEHFLVRKAVMKPIPWGPFDWGGCVLSWLPKFLSRTGLCCVLVSELGIAEWSHDLVALTESLPFAFVRRNAVLQRSTHHVCITRHVDVFPLLRGG